MLDKACVLLGTHITEQLSAPGSGCGAQRRLDLAFDPKFGRDSGQPGYRDFYLAFTAQGSDPQLGAVPDQVARGYTVSNPVSNNATAATRMDVNRFAVRYSNHIGGDIHFGPDGHLYYGMGDGDIGGEPNGFAQCLWKKTDDLAVVPKAGCTDCEIRTSGASIAAVAISGLPMAARLSTKRWTNAHPRIERRAHLPQLAQNRCSDVMESCT